MCFNSKHTKQKEKSINKMMCRHFVYIQWLLASSTYGAAAVVAISMRSFGRVGIYVFVPILLESLDVVEPSLVIELIILINMGNKSSSL